MKCSLKWVSCVEDPGREVHQRTLHNRKRHEGRQHPSTQWVNTAKFLALFKT